MVYYINYQIKYDLKCSLFMNHCPFIKLKILMTNQEKRNKITFMKCSKLGFLKISFFSSHVSILSLNLNKTFFLKNVNH